MTSDTRLRAPGDQAGQLSVCMATSGQNQTHRKEADMTSATFVQKVSSDNCEPQGCLCRHYIGFASVWRVPSVVYLRVCCLQGRFASPASIARIPNAFLHDLWIQALHYTVETLAIRRMMFGKCALEHARFKCSSLTHCSRLQKTQCVKPPQSSATTRFI